MSTVARDLVWEAGNDLFTKLRKVVTATCNTDEGTAFKVYDASIINDIRRQIGIPCAGVAYESMEPFPAQNACKTNTVYLNFGIYVIVGKRAYEVDGIEYLEDGTRLLQAIRDEIWQSRNPFGKEWEFVVEVTNDFGDTGIGYYQRWRSTGLLSVNR